jgi:hypothetical protein
MVSPALSCESEAVDHQMDWLHTVPHNLPQQADERLHRQPALIGAAQKASLALTAGAALIDCR